LIQINCEEITATTHPVAGACGSQPQQSNRIWWDTFAIPLARPTQTTPQQPIPGYFKMQSRFVDYSGAYVMHCHILVHEDRNDVHRCRCGRDAAAGASPLAQETRCGR
jgi:hypothetical protein